MKASAPRLPRRGFLQGAAALALCGCQERFDDDFSLYALIDISSGYFHELDKAVHALRELMGFMRAHDSLAVAMIGGCSFSDEATILRFTTPDRSSERRRLLAAYAERLSDSVARAKATSDADMREALAWAARQLVQRPAMRHAILLFSDLDDDLPPTCRHESTLPPALKGVEVIAANVVRLPDDDRDPQRLARRLERWRRMVEASGASWQIIEDPADIVTLLKNRPL